MKYEIKLKCKNCDKKYWDTTEEGLDIFLFAKFNHICMDKVLAKSQKIIGICDVIAYREKK
jgi:hypothetical protein